MQSTKHAVGSRLLTLASLVMVSGTAAAENLYISGSLGQTDQDSTFNRGTFTSDFTTGTVTGVTPPLDIPAGAAVNWNTDYDTGDFYSLAFGWKMDRVRFELEYHRINSDVDRHTGVTAAGIDLSAIDAGVLIAGNVGDLGVTVAELVADGQGEIETSSLMINGYYDFDMGGNWTPYLGLGIGRIDTDVTFIPSGVGVLNASDDDYGFQLLAGVSYDFTENVAGFVNYRYLDGGEVSLGASLLPATFELENDSQSIDVGIRYSF